MSEETEFDQLAQELDEALTALTAMRQRAERAEAQLATIKAIYDSLAPDWTTAPEGATIYTIDADGRAQWMKLTTRTDKVEPIPRSSKWSMRYAWWAEVANYVDLPIGADWRKCIWQKPTD